MTCKKIYVSSKKTNYHPDFKKLVCSNYIAAREKMFFVSDQLACNFILKDTTEQWIACGGSFLKNEEEVASFEDIQKFFIGKQILKKSVSKWIKDGMAINILTINCINHPEFVVNGETSAINLNTPILPPDVFPPEYYKNDSDENEMHRRQLYNQLRDDKKNKSKFRGHCNHYVSDTFYKNIDDNSFVKKIILPEGDNTKGVDLKVDLLNGGFSLIKVRNTQSAKLKTIEKNTKDCFSSITSKSFFKVGNARGHVKQGYSSSRMFAFGQKGDDDIYSSNKQLSKKNLKNMCRYIERGMENHFGQLLKNIWESDRKEEIDLLGKYAKTVVVSVNLANPSHMDRRDGSKGVSMWLKKNPTSNSKNWWFVLPNLTCEGHKGVVIKLHHGICIEWDGRIIRHCTAVPDVDEDDALFGVFFCAKSKDAKEQSLEQLPLVQKSFYNK